MPTRQSRRFGLAVAAASALFLFAACASPERTTASLNRTPAPPAPTATAVPLPPPVTATSESTPLIGAEPHAGEELVAQVFEISEQQWIANWNLREEHTLGCMAGLGLDYEPRPRTIVNASGRFEREALKADMTLVEFAEAFGFGWATLFEFWSPPTASGEWHPIEDRCQNEAAQAVNGARFEAMEVLSPAWEELQSQIQADPAVVALNRSWTVCMTEAGFTNVDSVEVFIEGYRIEYLKFSGGAINRERARADGRLSDEEQQTLERLQTEEIAAAVQSEECEAPLREQREAVTASNHIEFEADFGTLLEQARWRTE